MVVRITDEFNTVFSVTCNSSNDVIRVVEMWLSNLNTTPIYEIVIEI